MCTGIRFNDKQGNFFFGRNLDWSFSYGEKVVVVPRGFDKEWCFDKTHDGKGRNAVIGMGIVVDNTPLFFDCASDSLAIAGLNFPGFAQYEDAPVEGKTNIAAYEFPYWVTANFSSVDEVEKALDNVAIVGQPIGKYAPSMLHWLIGDAKRSIVVEHTASGMHVYHDELDALTNQPEFPWHQENCRNYMAVTPQIPGTVVWGEQKLEAYGSGFGMLGLPGAFNSSSRFVRVAYNNAHYPVQDGETLNVARLFHTLAGSAMIEGGAIMSDGDFEKTIYTGGFSQATKTYYYNTYEDYNIHSVAMSDYDLDGSKLVVAD